MTTKLTLVALLICNAFCNGSMLKEISPLGQEQIGPYPDYDGPCDGVFPDPDDCRQFIQCWEGVGATLWTCTDQMLFDLEYYGCNYAQQVHCEDRPRPTDVPSTINTPGTTVRTTTSNVTVSTRSTTPPPPTNYTCPEGDGVFAHETRCEYYWNCYGGEVVLVHCPSDHLFDRVYNGCNYPEYTDCDHRERPEGSGPNPTTKATAPPPSTTPARPTTPEIEPTQGTGPTTTTRRPFQCPGDDGKFADPYDCTAFYQCAGGIPYRTRCPVPLYYNEISEQCDYRNNVDCGDRPEN